MKNRLRQQREMSRLFLEARQLYWKLRQKDVPEHLVDQAKDRSQRRLNKLNALLRGK